MNIFDYSGKVKEVGELKTFASGFKTRTLVCQTTNYSRDGKEWTDFAIFEAKKDLADEIALLKEGQDVTISFALEGRAWEDPKTNSIRWFGGARVVSFKMGAVAEGGTKPSTISQAPEEEMPF